MKIDRMALQNRFNELINPPQVDRDGNEKPAVSRMKVRVVLDKTRSISKGLRNDDSPAGRGNNLTITINPNKYRTEASLNKAIEWIEGEITK